MEEEKGVVEVEKVKPQFIKEFLMIMRKKGRTVTYMNDLLKAFKVYFRYAYTEGYTETLLTEKIPNAKGEKIIIRIFSDSETKRMIGHYQGHDYLTLRNKVMLLMLVDTGIRVGELRTMTEAQVKEDYIIVKGKGAKERVVPKSPYLGKWLIKYLAVRNSHFQYRITPDNMFLSKNARAMTGEAIAKVLKAAGRACNVSGDVRVSAHTFRHTYAQYQIKSGLDIYSLSRLLGHESISITQTYLNGMRDKEVLLQAQRTSPLMNL